MTEMQHEHKYEPITVAALTGGERIASARFRFRQYAARLNRHAVHMQEHIPFWGTSCGLPSPFKMAARIPGALASRRADVVWLNKELVQGYLTFERHLKRPRVLDVDDAIWLNRPFGKRAQPKIARAMDAVIAGNEYLADYYRQYCDTVYVVPTAVDLDRYRVRSAEPESGFVIGWTGQRVNFEHLDQIEGALAAFLARHADASLLILSNHPWRPERIGPERIRNMTWTPEREVAELYNMHVGIMPLKDDAWAQGKCSFKMLQYMAAGLPVIVSPVGMNRDVLAQGPIGFGAESEDQWLEHLETLYADAQLRRQQGLAGRRVAEAHYNADRIAERLAEVFHELAGR